MNKSVSIIVSVYNEEKYIAACLDSLLKQNYSPMEIIVVDDGSTDNTKKIVKRYSKVNLPEQKHLGTALARNYGVKFAKGEILVFVDADMKFEDDFIYHLVKSINNNLAKGTFSKLEYVANWEKPLARCWNRNNNPPLPDKLRVRQDIKEGEDFRAILKSEFAKVGGFDNTGYTDTWSLAKKLGYKPMNAENTVYYHYNPETFKEIFESAKWIGKREYKMGIIGIVFALFRSCFLFSPFKGLLKNLKYKEILFVPFQFVYDWGLTIGLLEKIYSGKVYK